MSAPQVAIVACRTYGPELAPALEALLAQLGGWPPRLTKGCRVLVKPNLLADALPEKAVTTHPELVRQVVRSLRHAGAQVTVGDSPASAMDLERVWRVTGIGDVCREEQVPLLSFEKSGTCQVTRDGYVFSVAKAVMEADLIVNLPKVKSHALATLTAAVKNFYGVLPGYQKAQLHRAYPKPKRFCRLLRALYAAMPPSFSIADGVIGMEGEGPMNGTPVALGFLAAAADAVALDLAICRVVGLDAHRVPYLKDYADAAETFALVGDPPAMPRFHVPSGGAHLLQMLPEPLVRLARPWVWIRPHFNQRCMACGRCVAACPTKALTLVPGGRPVLARERCIACCCCHEVCPAQAIRMRRGPLLRLMGVFRGLD